VNDPGEGRLRAAPHPPFLGGDATVREQRHRRDRVARTGRSLYGRIVALVLYWRPGSAAMAPHAALAEIGLDYELVRIERDQAQSDPAYLALNPLGVVPTLVDDDRGLVLTESAAILLYLADRYPEARLAPSDRAPYYRWLVFLTNTVQTAMLRFFYPERYGGAEDVSAAAAVDAQRAFDVIERELEAHGWLTAGHRTGADLFLFMLTRWGRRLEPAAWERPRLREHFLQSLELPGVRRMIEEQGLDLPEFAA
jgi:glutathione S-transferase